MARTTWRHPDGAELLCERCSRGFARRDRRGPRPKFCSSECCFATSDERRNEKRRLPAQPQRPCAECGDPFEPLRRDQRYCNRLCKGRAVARAAAERGYQPPPRTYTPEQYDRMREARRDRKHRRRARTKGASERVLLQRVAERDEWVCHLCRNSLGPVTRANWSLDHVVPLSAGGAHSLENCALAHLDCNVRKGARNIVQITYSTAS